MGDFDDGYDDEDGYSDEYDEVVRPPPTLLPVRPADAALVCRCSRARWIARRGRQRRRSASR
jgi:hypothetical protein